MKLGNGQSRVAEGGLSVGITPSSVVDVHGEPREALDLRSRHAERAVRRVALHPLVPGCAGAVFERLAATEKSTVAGGDQVGGDPKGYGFLARIMSRAYESVAPGSLLVDGSDNHRQALVKNYRLISLYRAASPELRQIMRGVCAVLGAPGIENRLGEPGFLEELQRVCVERFRANTPLFAAGAERGAKPPNSFRLLVRDVQREMEGFLAEFNSATLCKAPLCVDIARRVAADAKLG